jgi:hypothetical protein
VKSLVHDADRAEIIRRLATVRPDSVARWGRMSAHQMVCHLADAFRMALGQKRVTLESSLLKRTILKWIVLYAPLRWPPGIRTSAELDQRGDVSTRPAEFAADMAEVGRLVDLAARTRSTEKHPYFGPMSDSDWWRWGYLHADHHLRQFDA